MLTWGCHVVSLTLILRDARKLRDYMRNYHAESRLWWRRSEALAAGAALERPADAPAGNRKGGLEQLASHLAHPARKMT
jgi:hypothetical protein